MKKRIVLLVLLALMILVSGCDIKDKEKVGKVADQYVDLSVGYAPGLGNMLFFIAEQEGYFKEEGLNINLVAFTSPGDGLNALNAGKIDLGITFGTAAPLTFITNGMDFTLFGGFLAGGQPIFANKSVASNYNSLDDFKGKRVATPRLTTPDIVWRSTMYRENIDIQKDLELIEVKKPTDVIEAVKSGKADIGIGVGANYPIINAAELEIIEWSADLWENHSCCRSVAKTEFISENKETIGKFMKAIIKAEKKYNEDPELAISINQDYLDIDYETAKKMTLETKQFIEADPRRKGIIEMWDRMSEIGYLDKKDIDIENHIDTVIYFNALKEILEENPNDEFYLGLENRYQEYNID